MISMGIAMIDRIGDTLVIQDRMRTVWVTRAFGVLFTAVPALLMLVLVFTAITEPTKAGIGIVLCGLVVLGFVALGGSTLLLADHHRTTFDRATGKVTLLVSNPQRQLAETYPFADVQSVGVVQWPGSRGKVVIRPVLNLTGDREVHTVGASLARAEAEAAVGKIAQFLAVPQDTMRDGSAPQLEVVDGDDNSQVFRIGSDLSDHWIRRAFGLLFAAPVAWGLYGVAIRMMTGSAKVDLLGVAIGGWVFGAFAATALLLMFSTAKVTIVDATNRQIKLQQVDWRGRHSEQLIAFADVKHVGITERRAWFGRPGHQPVLTLHDGLEFSVARLQSLNDAERTAKKLAKVVGLPMEAVG
jgi:hypothetical protein